jgi:transcription elongation factor/antiterminator RfaH
MAESDTPSPNDAHEAHDAHDAHDALHAAHDERRWFACYTKARHEKRVAQTLEERGFESFLPIVREERQWKDRKKLVEFPLFPSYVFGRFSISEVYAVLSIPGISTIVRMQGQPVPIRDEDIANVRRFALALSNTGIQVEAVPFIDAGQRVEVVDGPFCGIEGFVVERRTRRRVLVGLEAIGQGLEVDIETRFLRVIGNPSE